MGDQFWNERSQISGVGTTGTSASLQGDIIDMASNGGFESVMFIGQLSASANATATGTYLKVSVGTASDSLTDSTGDVRGTKKTLYLDVYRPKHRFVRGTLMQGSATIAYETLHTIAYGARRTPTTQPASTTGIALQSPGTGTATG